MKNSNYFIGIFLSFLVFAGIALLTYNRPILQNISSPVLQSTKNNLENAKSESDTNAVLGESAPEETKKTDDFEGIIPYNDQVTDMPKAKLTLEQKLKLPSPRMEIDVSKNYFALLKTEKGDIKIDLNEKETPITVNNFVYLSRLGYYDETVFHRIIEGFMIQGGDPTGTGTGSPGYKFDDENFSGNYFRGTVAMANSGPNTNGSQFFIMHQDYPLPSNYVIFGSVIEGIDIVDQIATMETMDSGSGENSLPVNPVMIKSVEIKEE